MSDAPELLLWGVPELRAGRGVVFAGERRFQLLVLLALQAGRWIERDRIAALLWPEHDLAEARRNLRKVLFVARRTAGGLEAGPTALRWSVRTDLQAFDDDRLHGRLAEALAWRRGEPLQAVDDPDNAELARFFAAERARIEHDWQTAAADHLRAQAGPQARIEAARRWLAADPFAEPAVAALLKAERESGRHAEARAAYRHYAARLAEELGVEPSRALRDLVEDRPDDVEPPRWPRPAPGPVPASASGVIAEPAPAADPGFVGRRLELAELAAMLARPECRLLTIVGPGGSGKSSLARRALAEAAALHAGGAHWVELQDLNSVAPFVARLAQRLGVDVDTGDPVEPLARRLGSTPTLLVLDNAEHLHELPALLQRLLAAAPALRLLVTSRERLRIEPEWLLPLQGLAVPDAASRDLEAASAFDAVRLFAQRAAAAQRGFRLDAHLDAVIDIADAVGGLPLALELAAHWVRLLPPAEIARELRESIDLLERDPAAAVGPSRDGHHSLRAVLDQSWQALAPRERQALADLAVFGGGFTRAAASAVAGVSMPLLSSLVDRSLLAVDETGRFAMHPLVASFAAERAAAAPERRAAAALRHAEHFARQLGGTGAQAGDQVRAAALRIDAEFANVMLAWQHAVQARRADLVCALVRALWPYFEERGRVQEAFELFRPALHLPDNQPMSARALTWLRQALAMLHSWRGEHEQGLALADAGVASGERCGDAEALIGCLIVGATCRWKLGRFAPARAESVRAVALAREHGDRNCLAWALHARGTLEHALGEHDAAIESLRGALAIDRELGRPDGAAQQLNNLGALLNEQGRWAEARPLLEEGLQLAVKAGHARIEAYVRKNLGTALHRLGDRAGARVLLRSAAARARELGLHQVDAACQRELAHVALDEGELGAALQGLRDAVAAAARHGQAAEGARAMALFGDWLAAAGEPARGAAVWRAVAGAAPGLTRAQRDEIESKLLRAPSAADATASLDELPRWLAAATPPPQRR
jgi:predicted ATPase/DNA-binding SARP family transcriptional activator